MELDDLAGNRYLLAAVAVAVVLVTGFLVQGGGPGLSAQSATMADAGAKESLSFDAAGPRVAGSGGGGGDALESPDRKKITTVRMDIEVDDVQQAQTDIENMAGSYNGIVTDTSLNRRFGERGRMVVRVPEANLSSFTSGVEGAWHVASKDTSVEDVTQRHTELTLELANKRQEMERLQELMNRTDDVENLIKIQERMGELRTRIQYLENQLTQLEERVEFATVTITMEEASTFESEFEIRRSFTEAYRGVFESLNLMIVGTGYLLPFAVLLALLYFGKRKWNN